ncbi:MAG: 1-deoxy-D-xylulose-5-phosphate synthase [Rhizobiales bacterium]|nr:1-deoxy-D-xylulose-5-phosphate synthase [Hyphomicrobiales bacterium]
MTATQEPQRFEDRTGASGHLADISTPSDLRRLPVTSLRRVCDELRRDLIAVVSRTGGHLGSGLGVVELTVALHYVFDTPRDKLLWDVSHQCYPHKLLTGRRGEMERLRLLGGPSGFTCRAESQYDPFGAAHSSTAISAGLGFATARDLAGGSGEVVSVVGDGAMTGGMAFEALNNLGAEGRRLIVVLNDNDMSIAEPSGALASHLRRLRARMPDRVTRHAALSSVGLSSFSAEPTLFDALGVPYFGPYDGHDIDEMIAVLKAARAHGPGPLLIHVLTEKGHGYAPAANAADRGHGVSRFDVATGVQNKPVSVAPAYTSVFASALVAEAERHHSIVAVTAAMPSGTGLDRFAKAFPDRTFDVGIAEQHGVTFCAGLAAAGMKPFAAIYSTFLQRGYDQVVHDVAIQRLPVRFAIDRAGLVGPDGVTHHGSYDVTYLGCLPGFVLMAAGDEADLMHMVATAAVIDDRPSAVRYPRGEGLGVPLPARGEPLEIGRGRVSREGCDLAILSYGALLGEALQAAEALAKVGISVTVADARFAKPLDDELVRRLLATHRCLLMLEEGAVGGFFSQVCLGLERLGLEGASGRVKSMHLPDAFIHHDSRDGQLASARLGASAIVARVLLALDRPAHRSELAELVAAAE